MTKFVRTISLLATTQLYISPAFAQDSFDASDDFSLLYGDEEIISIATGTQKPIHLAPSVTSVITANDLKEMGISHLNEALELIPGLHVTPSAFNRMVETYSMRGILTGQNPQVLLTLNGTPIRNAANSARLYGFRFPVESISRIEVIRGPGSAVHGADAFAGVINIITKDRDEIGAGQAGVRAGSFNSKDSWAQKGFTYQGWDVAVSLGHTISDGDGSRIVNSDNAAPALSFAPAPVQTRYNALNTIIDIQNDHWDINFWQWNQRGSGLGAGANQAIDPLGADIQDFSQLDIGYTFPEKIKEWEFSSKLSLQKADSISFLQIAPPGTLLPAGLIGNPGYNADNESFEIVAIYSSLDKHHIRLSVGGNHQKIKGTESKNFGAGATPGVVTDVTNTPDVWLAGGTRSKSSWFLSLQDEWRFAPDWEFTGGIRYDDYSDFGGTVNPRMAFVWAADYNLTNKLLIGSAFRAPSFTELYLNANNTILEGNPDLKPEQIDTVELVFDYRPNFELQDVLNIYAFEAKDLIDNGPSSGTAATQSTNLNQQQGYGVEAESTWKPNDKTRLSLNLSFHHSEDKKTKKPIPFAPNRLLKATALRKLDDSTSAFVSLIWVGDRHRESTDTRDMISDYAIVNTNFRKQMDKQVELSMGIRNLLDEDAREPSSYKAPPLRYIAEDYPMEGRSVYFEFRYHLDAE